MRDCLTPCMGYYMDTVSDTLTPKNYTFVFIQHTIQILYVYVFWRVCWRVLSTDSDPRRPRGIPEKISRGG